MPYAACFCGALVATLILTPLVREMNKRLGMVDKPDPRRINKVPIPRGGGLALVIGVEASFAILSAVLGFSSISGISSAQFVRVATLAVVMAMIGLADDKFSLSPKLKLLGQVVVASLAWLWADIGVGDVFSAIPAWFDFVLTVCWIVGAVNAFNLIDGLDGLASGLAFIATMGMAGSLMFSGHASSTLFYFSFAGGLLGFLRYNYNPASVFLGDCGSMYIGFVLSVLPLCSHVPDSFLVSVGVPLLAMGVPMFDTALAILRRSIRRLLNRGVDSADGQVMTADKDHIHHRILRSVGLNQRKAAWVLYAFATFLVAVGLVAMSLRSRAAGLWLFAVTVAAVVIFRDMARIELFDAGRLLRSFARAHDVSTRRKIARLAVPLYLLADVTMLSLAYLLVAFLQHGELGRRIVTAYLPIRVTSVFVFLVALGAYRIVWPRATLSNYMRLALACVFGSVLGSVVNYYFLGAPGGNKILVMTLSFAMTSIVGAFAIRTFRGMVRDFFYSLDCARLVGRKDVSRILVYGSGLRYRTFRRELVRTTAANDRIIVGILDDDLLLRGHYVGDVKVLGTLMEAREIINEVNADAVVIACEVSPEWMKVVRKMLEPTGVKVTHFSFNETKVM